MMQVSALIWSALKTKFIQKYPLLSLHMMQMCLTISQMSQCQSNSLARMLALPRHADSGLNRYQCSPTHTAASPPVRVLPGQCHQLPFRLLSFPKPDRNTLRTGQWVMWGPGTPHHPGVMSC